MKLLVSLCFALLAQAASWDQLTPFTQRQVEVISRQGEKTRGLLLSVTPDSLSLSHASGQKSFPKSEVQELRLHDPEQRRRRAWIFTGLGAGAGAGLGVAVCPGCANEGNGAKFVAPGVAIGAGLGALSFLASPYRTIYRFN
ncbi:hypothetical protein WDZ92_44355 [Nostoc sp. NIES-2111]